MLYNFDQLFVFRMLINVTALLYHEDTSSAEAYNVTTTFYFPPILKFNEVVYCNLSTPTTNPVVTGNGIEVKVHQHCLLWIYGGQWTEIECVNAMARRQSMQMIKRLGVTVKRTVVRAISFIAWFHVTLPAFR